MENGGDINFNASVPHILPLPISPPDGLFKQVKKDLGEAGEGNGPDNSRQ